MFLESVVFWYDLRIGAFFGCFFRFIWKLVFFDWFFLKFSEIGVFFVGVFVGVFFACVF